MSYTIKIYNTLDCSTMSVNVQESAPSLKTISELSGFDFSQYKVKTRSNKDIFVDWPDGRIPENETMLYLMKKDSKFGL